MLPNMLNVRGGLELENVYYTYTLIKAKQFFIDFSWKLEYDAKKEWIDVMGQDLSANMTLSARRVNM